MTDEQTTKHSGDEAPTFEEFTLFVKKLLNVPSKNISKQEKENELDSTENDLMPNTEKT